MIYTYEVLRVILRVYIQSAPPSVQKRFIGGRIAVPSMMSHEGMGAVNVAKYYSTELLC